MTETTAERESKSKRSNIMRSESHCNLSINLFAPTEFTNSKLSIRAPDPGVDFLLDGLKFEAVQIDEQWRFKTYQSIDKHRKANITFK